jgi:hypothetical protein
MISKIIKGKNLKSCLVNVLQGFESEIINANIDCETIDNIIDEFQLSKNHRPNLKKTVCHIILCPHPSDRISEYQWLEILDQYLFEMGFTNNQFIAVRHITKGNEHIHLITSRVRLDGSVVSDSWERIHSQTILRDIEKQYNLSQVRSSWENDGWEEGNSLNSHEIDNDW